MMRKYQDKQNAQKKSYFSDRFAITPSLPRFDVSEDEIFNADLEALKQNVEVKEAFIEADQLVIWIEPKDNVKTLEIFKSLDYENLSELSAIDFIAKKGGYEVFYQLLSMKKHKRARVKIFVEQKEKIQSVESIYKSANWAEREMYDMLGVQILNHPDLRRILMPDDWSGHPLLKSYPLQGDEDAQWYEIDRIFGKEKREEIGEEQRDTAKVCEEDTINFSRLNHGVLYGTPMSKEETKEDYQEEGGVVIIKKAKKEKSKIIKGRR